jgi:alpha-tubulin suppressor-like RCC1 family protein
MHRLVKKSTLFVISLLFIAACGDLPIPSETSTSTSISTSTIISTSIETENGLGFTYLLDEDAYEVASYTGFDITIQIPENFNEKSVIGIGRLAFSDHPTIEHVILPSSIQYIDDFAFLATRRLASIVFNAGLKHIGNAAFAGNRFLQSINLPSSLTSIGNQAFFENISLTSFSLPLSVTEIGSFILQSASKLESIMIPGTYPISYYFGEPNQIGTSVPSSLKKIFIQEGTPALADSFFAGATFVEEVIVPTSVTNLGHQPFKGLDNLVKLEIPFLGQQLSSNNYLGYLFGDVISIQQAEVIPASLEEIIIHQLYQNLLPNYAFYNLVSLRVIQLPTNYNHIGDYAFYGVNGLRSMTLPEGLETIGNYAFYGHGLETLTIPGSVTTIGEAAFAEGNRLTSITFPEESSLVSIGEKAFKNNGLVSELTIPEGVEDIGQGALSGMNGLVELTVPFVGGQINQDMYLGYIFGASHYQQQANHIPVSLRHVHLHDVSTRIGEGAFYDVTHLETITINERVTTIDAYAFYNLVNVESMTLPEGLETIGNYAFYNTRLLNEINLNEGFLSIGDYAFYSSGITELKFPSSLIFLGSYVFYNTSNLKDVILPSGLTLIGDYAFYNSSLTSILFSSNLHGIGDYAFYGVNGLRSMTLPEGLETIGNYAFYGHGLETLTIPGSVTTIGEAAFAEGNRLTSITFPEESSLVSIGEKAFKNNGLVSELTIPEGVEDIGQGALSGMNGLVELTVPFVGGQINQDMYLGYIFGASHYQQQANHIPVSLRHVHLHDVSTRIGEGAFYDVTHLETITINERVTTIDAYAFYNLVNVESMTLPEGLETIGNYAFYGHGLETLTIPGSVTTIGEAAFAEGNRLTSITFPEESSLVSIGEKAFKNNGLVSELTIPEGVEDIGQGALSGMNGLVELTVPFVGGQINQDMYLGYIFGASHYQQQANHIPVSLRHVHLHDVSTRIGEGAFYDVTHLETITINERVTTIDAYAFYNLVNVESMTLPEGLETIGNYAFYGMSMSDWNFPNSLLSIGSYAFAYVPITSLTLPNQLLTLESFSFSHNVYLTSVDFGSTSRIQSIKNDVFFGNTGLTELIIPSSVVLMENGSLRGLSSLETLSIPFVGRSKLTSHPSSVLSGHYFGSIFGSTSYPNSVLVSQTSSTGQSYSFYIPQSLTSLTIEAGHLGYGHLSNLSSIQELHLLEDIGGIQNAVLHGMSQLTTLTIPFVGSSPKPSISSEFDVFGHLFGYSLSAVHGVTTNQGNGRHYFVPLSLIDVTILGGNLNNNSFYNLRIPSIKLPSTPIYIGTNAFFNFETETVNLGRDGRIEFFNPQLLTIAPYAFANFSYLNHLSIFGKSDIQTNAFNGLITLEYIDFLESTSFGASAFKDATGLISIHAPKLVTIGNYAFQGASSLTRFNSDNEGVFNLPSTVTSIGQGAFQNVGLMIEITVPFVGMALPGTGVSVTHPFGYIFNYVITSTQQSGGTMQIPASAGIASSNTWYFIPQTISKITVLGGNIPSYAFYNMTWLEEVVIPQTMTSLGSHAFYNNTNLAKVNSNASGEFNIPSGVTSIGIATFFGNEALTELNVYGAVTSIGANALQGTINLLVVGLPNTTSIGTEAFRGVSSLPSIELPNVTSIGASAFKDATGLISIHAPKLVTIGNYAFQGASSLTRFNSDNEGVFNLPSTVTSIGQGAFQNVGLMIEITVPFVGMALPGTGVSVTHPFGYIFNYVITSTQQSGGTMQIPASAGIASSNTWYFIPQTISKITVLGGNIPSYAFYNMTWLEEVVIPQTMTSLGSHAFYNNTNLAKVNSNASGEFNIPSGVTSIGIATFFGNEALTELNVYGAVTSIGANALQGTINLLVVGLPNTTSIGTEAFRGVSSLPSIELPNVTSIGASAFKDATGLISIHAPKLVTIGNYAFQGASSLTRFNSDNEGVFNLPSTVTSIGQGAFQNVGLMIEITVPFVGMALPGTGGSVTHPFGYIFNYVITSTQQSGGTMQIPASAGIASSNVWYFIPQTISKITVLGGNIPSYAFYNMTWLEEVVIPQTMTSLGSHAFYNNTNLAKVNSNASGEFNIPSGVTSIGIATFFGNEALTELNVYGAVTSIGANALQGTINLLVVGLPNTTSIGTEAFRGVSSLPSIELPNVTSIGASAFKDATGLISIHAPKLVTIGNYAFQGASSLTRFNSDNEGVFNLPSTVTSIGQGAFQNVGLMIEITVPFVGMALPGTGGSVTHPFGYIFNYVITSTQQSGGTMQIPASAGIASSNVWYFIPQTISKITVLGGNIPSYAFYNMTWLEEVVIPQTMTSLGSHAFYNNTNLAKVNSNASGEFNIPSGVTSIGIATFFGNEALTELNVYGAVTSIGANALQGTINLLVVGLPNTTSIGTEAFRGVSSLPSIELPNVTSIGASAFKDATGLISIHAPKLVTIGNYAFQGASSLTRFNSDNEGVFNLPSTVTSIGQGAFQNVGLMIEITVPFVGMALPGTGGSVTHPFGYIFNYVITSTQQSGGTMQIPASAGIASSNVWYFIPQTISKITVLGGNIPSYAFYNMTWLEEVVIPQTMTSLGSHAFYNNTNLAKVNSNASGEFNIPSGVTSIGIATFFGNEALTELNVYGAVTSIGANALQGTINLLVVGLPNTTSIGTEAFRGVSSLPSIELPNVTSIGASAFKDATGLISIHAPKLVTIGNYAFQGASSLTRFNSDNEGVFNLPSTVTSIGQGAFQNVGLMIEITVPFVGMALPGTGGSVTHPFGYIFNYVITSTQQSGGTMQIPASAGIASSNVWYFIPQTISKITVLGGNIPSYAFYNMTWLEEVVIPQTMTSLGSHAFYNNTNLAKVNSNASGEFNIPSGVTSIGIATFFGNEALTELNVYGAVTSIGANALQGTINLLVVGLPNTTSIGTEAFRGVSSLPSIELPNVTSIGASAFKDATGLISIHAPKLVTIGNYAFQGASSLTRFNSDNEGVFNLPSTVTSIGQGAFQNVGLMIEITVPFVGMALPGTGGSVTHPFGYIFNYVITSTQQSGGTMQIPASAGIASSNVWYFIPQTISKITVLGGNIPSYAFYNMTWLEEVVIYTENVIIGSYSFEGLSSTLISRPKLLMAGNNLSIKAGELNSIMIKGNNEFSLIDSTSVSSYDSFQTINFEGNVITIGVGYDFIIFGNALGDVYSKGNNRFGQLGDSTVGTNGSVNWSKLTFPNLQSGEKNYTVFAGHQFAGVISSNNRLFMWGDNTYGQLGLGNTNQQNNPALVSLTGRPIFMSLGHYHSLMLNNSNQVYAWGRNDMGQVGDSTLTNKLSPALISFANLNAGEVITQLGAGENFSLALTNQGRLYAWGSNDMGQLGSSMALSRSIIPRIVPVSQLQLGETIIKIDVGPQTAYALTNFGRVLSWGSNSNGELGQLDISFSNIPTILSFSSHNEPVLFSRINAGYNHVIAITVNDEFYEWGNISYL